MYKSYPHEFAAFEILAVVFLENLAALCGEASAEVNFGDAALQLLALQWSMVTATHLLGNGDGFAAFWIQQHEIGIEARRNGTLPAPRVRARYLSPLRDGERNRSGSDRH